MIRAEFRGKILEFPDGTPVEVINKTVKTLATQDEVIKRDGQLPPHMLAPGMEVQPTSQSGAQPVQPERPQSVSQRLAQPAPIQQDRTAPQNVVQHSTSTPSGGAKAILPRLMGQSDGASLGEAGAAVGADLLSLPGRAISSGIKAVVPGGEGSIVENMADTEGSNFGDRMIRSPGLAASVLAAPLTGGASLGALAANATIGAAGTQLSNIGKEEGVNVGEFVAEAALGTFLPKAITKGVSMGAGAIPKFALNRSVKKLMAEAKPTGAMRAKGFKPDILRKHEVGGTLIEASETVGQKLAEARAGLQRSVDELSKSGELPKIDLITQIDDLVSGSAKDITDSGAKDVLNVANELKGLIKTKAIDGNLNIAEAIDIKRSIGGMRKWGDRGDKLSDAADTFLGKVYDRLKFETNNIASRSGKDIAGYNQTMHELLPIESTLNKKLLSVVDEMDEGIVSKVKDIISKNPMLEVAGSVVVFPGAVTALKLGAAGAEGGSVKVIELIARRPDVIKWAKTLGTTNEGAANLILEAATKGIPLRQLFIEKSTSQPTSTTVSKPYYESDLDIDQYYVE